MVPEAPVMTAAQWWVAGGFGVLGALTGWLISRSW
jgi:hypothetical protein